MKTLQSFLAFAHRKRIAHFFITGVSGVMLNMLITWLLTEFVFGVDRYIIGYFVGTTVNICYNFFIHSILTFKTRKRHTRRFVIFVLFSIGSTAIQVGIVHLLTLYFGRAYYLPIIASTILVLSVLSFLFFKHSLFNEGAMEHMTTKQEIHEIYLRLKKIMHRIFMFISHDRHVLIIIIGLAMLTRLPFLSYPDRTLFDEVIYADFAIQTINQVPFFDIHPPLARMIFAKIADSTHESFTMIPTETNRPFGNFPYAMLRTFVAIFGILLPVIIYATGRMIGYRPHIALIPALFIIFDSALTLYARTMLPDTLMLVANFSGLLLILVAINAKVRRTRLLAIILAGLLLGAAISIKWTALGFLGLAILWLLIKRFWSYAVIIFSITFIVYVGVFYANFKMFPAGGQVQPILTGYDNTWVNQIVYPLGTDARAILKFIPEFQMQMFLSNIDDKISSQIMSAQHPLSWPTARAIVWFWNEPQSIKNIALIGNSILWVASFFAILFEIGWIILSFYRNRRWPIDENETMLFIGYLANYIPFFFIDRSMFLYHYFPALILLFLLIPKIAPRIIHCVNILARDKYIGYVIMLFVCVLIIANFILLSPTTYGF